VALDAMARTRPHDLSNAVAAAAVAASVGATPVGMAGALAGFAGLPHRVQLVANLGGVGWYDDSKATTPASVLAAVAGFDSVILIAGGRNKGLDLGALASTVPPVRAVVAIGEAGAEVEAAFAGLVPVEVSRTMAAAVSAARRLARPGDAVLLSPGCASFDWYGSYGERGDDFAALVVAQSGIGGGER
jgi:UDP-N-acetylmuramoylalanine--D-glutamate ligase